MVVFNNIQCGTPIIEVGGAIIAIRTRVKNSDQLGSERNE